MIRAIDSILDLMTMYRVVLYELVFLLCAAVILGTLGIIVYSPFFILYSIIFIFAVAWAVNTLFARAFDVASNLDSIYITALILALLIAPPQSFFDPKYLSLAAWAAAIAMASKYIFAIKKRHIFNPAAFGIAATAIFLNQPAVWWVGTAALLPAVIAGGLLVVRKIRRFDLFLSGLIAATIAGVLPAFLSGGNILLRLHGLYFDTALFFFATIMLTEPFTTPPKRTLRIAYGILVGILFVPNVHIGSLYFTPELALLIGNIFAYLVNPKERILLQLIERIPLSKNSFEFVFKPDQKLAFAPGEYMEWSLPHEKPDTRGIRRYFTIASAPSDPHIRLGVKFYEPSSTFKKALLTLPYGEMMSATGRAGEFTLPKDRNKKIAGIAGGIGITPFRSMLDELIRRDERRDMILLYPNRKQEDVAYKELLENAREQIGIHTHYAFSHEDTLVENAQNRIPIITPAVIKKTIPDYLERVFYISGPQAMVTNYADMLRSMGVAKRNIKKDFFPGFA
jgi:ferredoxin-NADP reductase/Na+-translocating ferredoxin:NAD+ oxidoreductase RnfD subunit